MKPSHITDQALRLKPDYMQAHVNLADTLVKAGQSATAIEHYRASAAIETGLHRGMFQFGVGIRQNKAAGRSRCICPEGFGTCPNPGTNGTGRAN